jgi:hypothetical protein
MEIILRKAAIQKSFSNIGKKNGSAPLEHTDNRFGIAYELFCASELRSAANKRYDMAKAVAKDAGIVDEEKCVEGSEITTYNNKYFDVTMKQASASTTLDKTMMKNVLMREFNLDEGMAQGLIDRASKPRKGAVTIGFALKG